MKYVQTLTDDAPIKHVVATLSSHLQKGERVVWLLSGGSAIEIEVRIAHKLQEFGASHLFIGLVDERYGPVGHANENYTLLLEAGFPLPITRVLYGESPEDTALQFGLKIGQALNDADYSLGIFGIGADGHTAGIKPHSPAVSSNEPAVFYQWDDYQRITITPTTIQGLDEAVVCASGAEKAKTLHTILHSDTALTEQPAQIVKQLRKSTLFTDQDL